MKRISFLLNSAFATVIFYLISHVYVLHYLSCYQNSWNIPHCLFVLDLSLLVPGMAALSFLLPWLLPLSLPFHNIFQFPFIYNHEYQESQVSFFSDTFALTTCTCFYKNNILSNGNHDGTNVVIRYRRIGDFKISISSQIPHITWNIKVHYCVHCPTVIILSQTNPLHTP